MDSELLSGAAGVTLSLVFSYIPGLREMFGNLSGDQKRFTMGACLIIVALFAYALGCANITDYVTCDKNGATGLVKTVLAALIANQSMYLISSASSR